MTPTEGDDGLDRVLRSVGLTGRKTRTLVRALFHARRRLSSAELADMLHADDPEGGPDYATASVSTLIHHARGRLRKAGVAICSSRSRGGGNGYWIEWIGVT